MDSLPWLPHALAAVGLAVGSAVGGVDAAVVATAVGFFVGKTVESISVTLGA